MDDEDMVTAAGIWAKGRAQKAALIELWVMLVKCGAAIGAITQHLGIGVIEAPAGPVSVPPDGPAARESASP